MQSSNTSSSRRADTPGRFSPGRLPRYRLQSALAPRASWPALLLLAVGLPALAGCGGPLEAQFAPNTAAASKADLLPEARQLVAEALTENFGTPHRLVAWKKFPIDFGVAESNHKDIERHKDGWRLLKGRQLYMAHCLHCHGVSGDGAGPTARFLSPLPRDYRQGIFKFKSTKGPLKPSRKDLVHILEQGIPGTYMPSFVLLGEEKLELLADYVRWLSLRGNTEIRLIDDLAATGATSRDVSRQSDDEKRPKAEVLKEVLKSIGGELPQKVSEIADDLATQWTEAEDPESVITPKARRTPPTQDSIERGKKFYLSQVKGKDTKCAECHGTRARGDGLNTESFWPIKGTTPERKYERAGLHDDWGNPQKPRDLTRGIYRGGRRPIDIYRRVHAGIPGTQMPGFGAVLNDEEIWDLVNYVLSIPFDEKQSPFPTEIETAAAEEPASRNVVSSPPSGDAP
jgi:mono/diheme cytochrome c family protein